MDQVIAELSFVTNGEGFTDITDKINQWVAEHKILQGMLLVFVKHTSCSLIINENADPRVLKDLNSYMKAIVPEDGIKPISGLGELKHFLHSDEGPDDMPAHIRTSLTCTSTTLGIVNYKAVLGTWQAIYLWEHRSSTNQRKIYLHAIGLIG